MKRKMSVIALLCSAALLFSAAAAGADILKKLSLDDPGETSPKIEADTVVTAEGDASLRIISRWPVTVCLGEVAGLDIENVTLVYSAQVKTRLEGAGSAFLEMWAHVDGGQYFSRGMDDTVGRESDWKTIRTRFTLQKGQTPEKITLNLVINGKGTVWIDDVNLAADPLK